MCEHQYNEKVKGAVTMNVRKHQLLRVTYAVSTVLILIGLAVSGLGLTGHATHGEYYLFGGMGFIVAAGFLFLFGVTMASLESASASTSAK